MGCETDTDLEPVASDVATAGREAITDEPHAAEMDVLPRVLLAEADGGSAASVAALLKSSGYSVELLTAASDVVSRVEQDPFAIVVVDWSLGGLDLLTHVRGNGDGGYTYVIFAGEDASDMHRAMAAGADDFLIKPLDTALLLARLCVAERLGRMRAAIASNNAALGETNRRLERSNARMHRELTEAARVQQALLPAQRFETAGVHIGWRLRPCTELAGDILNCIRLDERHLGFYVLDVSGHGVSSALLSVQVARLMSASMNDSGVLKHRLDEPPWYRIVEPRRVIHRLNQLFQMGEGAQYFTMLYGVLDLHTGQLGLAAAGHPGPIVVPVKGSCVPIRCNSHPVGMFHEPSFFSRQSQLEIGDRIWFFSDGLADGCNEHNESLGAERLQQFIESRRELPVQAAVDGVMDAVERWCRPAEPHDDCTLLAVERDDADSRNGGAE